MSPNEAQAFLDALDEVGNAPPPPAPKKPPGMARTIADMGIKAAQGAVDLGQSAVGLASLATGGLAGKAMRAVGYDPQAANQVLGEYLSDEQQQAEQNVQGAEGFTDTLQSMAENPRAIAGAVVESLPGMLGIGGVTRAVATRIALRAAAPFGGIATEAGKKAAEAAVEKAATRLLATSGAAEGAQSAGQIADQAQQAGREYKDYALPAVASGVATGAITLGAGKVLGDPTTALFSGSKAAGATGGLPGRVAKSFVSEGAAQEMPQSAQEQYMTNLAMGEEDPSKGVANQAASGLVVGGLMGAGEGAFAPHHDSRQQAADAVRARKVPEVGALSAAANVSLEGQAQDIENAPPPQPEPAAPPVVDAIMERIKRMPEQDRLDAAHAYSVVQREDVPKGVRSFNSKLLDKLLAKLEVEDARAAEAPPPLMLPAPAITVDAAGNAATTEQRQALRDGVAVAAPADIPSNPAGAEQTPEASIPEEAGSAATAKAPAPAPAIPQGTFATPEEAQAYISQQRRSGGSIPAALPLPMDDGSFGLAVSGSPEYAKAEAFKAKQDLRAAGVLDGDILTKSGGVFKNKLAASRTLKTAGEGHAIVPVQGGFVVRKESAKPAAAAPAAVPAQPGEAVQREPAGDRAAAGPDEGGAVEQFHAFPESTGTLGVARADMPQVKTEHHGALVNYLNARGVEHQIEEVDPRGLKPTQAEYSPQRVEAVGKAVAESDRSILVSSDGHVLDGHHQWLHAGSLGEPVKVIRLSKPAAEVLPLMKEFPSAQTAEGGDHAAQEAAPAAEAKAPAPDEGAARGSEAAGPDTGATAARADGGEGAAAVAPAPMSAVKQQLFVERGGQRFPVESLQEAAAKWDEFRRATMAGASEIGEGAKIIDRDGKEVARISYNGKVWPPGGYKPGVKPLVGENFKPSASAVIESKGEPHAVPEQSADASRVRGLPRARNEGQGKAVGQGNAEPSKPAAARTEGQEADRGNARGKGDQGVAKPLRVGVTPNRAAEVTVRDGVVHIGKDPALNFDTAQEVRVAKGATQADVKKALRDAGSITKRQKFFGGDEEQPMFRRGDSEGPGSKTTQIQQAVSILTRDWLRKPDIHVLHSMDEAPDPVRRVWERQNSQGAVGDIEGFHYRGGVYLVADALHTKGDVQRVLYHEALGHFGLRGLFGAKLDGVLKQVIRAMPKELDAKAQQYGLDLKVEKDRMTAAEELLAELAQTRPELGIIKRAVAAIRTWLREHGINVGAMSHDEIVRNFILPARGFVERGREAMKADAAPMFSRSPGSSAIVAGNTGRQYSDQQLAAMKNVGFAVEPVPLKEKIKSWWKDAGTHLAQGLVDQFAPIKEIDKDAYSLLRLAKGASGAFETLLKGGKLRLTDGVYDFDESQRGGVVDRLLIPLQGEHHDFLRWVAALRAERLMGEGRENLFSKDDITALKTLSQGELKFDFTIQHGPEKGQTTRSRALAYADSLKTYDEFNRNVLDMAEQSGLIDGEARKLWENEVYVPFYRVADERSDAIAGMNIKSGVVRQKAFEALKGGSSKLNSDLLDNTLLNWAHLIDAAAKNRAAKATLEAMQRMGSAIEAKEDALREMASSTGNRQGVVWFMDQGLQRHFLVDDPYLMTALSSLNYAGMNNPVMKAMGMFKHALTVGVTASPFFKVRNLIRDSLQVIATSSIDSNAAKNIAQGWRLTNPKADSYFRLLAGGGTIHFGTMLEGTEAKRVQALVESGIDAATILDGEKKVKAFFRKYIEPGVTAYQELGNRGEAVNRAALYDQLVKQGVSHKDASLMARDLLDFTMQGSWATIRFLTQVVPFFNARLQGLYQLGRGAKEDPARFAAVLGSMAAISVGLMAMYSDDDDWKRREDYDRRNFWWFKFGGTAFRIPKPFEIGAIATLAENGAEMFFDDEMTGKRFRDQVFSLLSDNLSMNPVPQLFKPLIDVYANKDSFTGRPIEPMGMENVKPEYRFTGRTSMAARAASTAMNAVTGLVDKEAPSPLQVEFLTRAYFGWLGSFVVTAGDLLARPATDQPEQPGVDYWKRATGGMVSQLADAPSRYVTQMYDQAAEIEKAYSTWKALLKGGKVEEAEAFRQEHADDIAKYTRAGRIKRAETALNRRQRMIENRQEGTAEQKREELRGINRQKEELAKQLALL